MTTLAAAGVLALLLVLVLVELRRHARRAPDEVARLEARVETLTQQLGERLGQSTAAAGQFTTMMQSQLDRTHHSLAQLAERIGRLDEATQQVRRVGESVAGLEQLLASPKLRGGLGEWTLELILAEVLPESQVMRQWPLPSRGVVVDVAVRTADGQVIPIDSKFPLESFRRLHEAEREGGEPAAARRREFHRAVRTRVDEIARKYISPEDGTLDFALMYVPSESIYYELAVRDAGADFLDYARSHRVVPCSPNTLYAYLQAILLGLRGAQIARGARELQATLEHLRQDVGRAREHFERAGGQLRHAAQNVEAAGAALDEAEARVGAAAGGAAALPAGRD